MTIKALIFDFDGLILDSEFTEYLSWQELFSAFEVPFPETIWRDQIGAIGFDPFVHLQAQIPRPLDKAAILQKRRARDTELLQKSPILAGVEAYLADAKALGLKIGLASSSDHAWVDHHLAERGLRPWFDVVVCRDDVDGLFKPDPAVYLLALTQLGVSATSTLAFEDSLNGVRAAKAAGVWVTAVPNLVTRSLDFSLADFRLDSLADMPLTQLLTEVFHVQNKL